MEQITPHLRRLLRARDTTAAQAITAQAHALPDAAELTRQQSSLEAILEDLLPTPVWRRLYPQWVVTDVMRSHDPSHPQPRHCKICAANAANQPGRLTQSA